MSRAPLAGLGHITGPKGKYQRMGSFSLFHWLVLLVVIMLLFGPSRLPSIGKNLGEAMRGLKQGLTGPDEDTSKLQASTDPKVTEPAKKG